MRFGHSATVVVIAALALGACKKDKDDDGYRDSVDCNDDDDTIHPDRPETCDGLDNDCDGDVDEGVLDTWYLDADGDSYGSAVYTTESCSEPVGYVDNDDDCDDTDELVHPGANETDCADPVDYNCDGSVGYADGDGDGYAACQDCDDADGTANPGADETCDGIDNDCDGAVDDNPVDAPTWYIDYDHDGYGSDSYSLDLCEQPPGYVGDATDCDDTSADAHPGGTELCDGVDNDCDGVVDSETAGDVVTAYPDADEDGYGEDEGAVLVCDVPSGYAMDGGDCDDSDAAVNPEASEVCDDGVDNDCDGTSWGCELVVDDGGTALLGQNTDDRAAVSVDRAGDVNSDGFVDLVIGAYTADAGSEGQEGVAYIVFGPVTAGEKVLGTDEVTLGGIEGSDRAGYLVAGIGDYDGDGIDDVVVNATLASHTHNSSGTAYLVTGATLGAMAGGDAMSLDDADYAWTGNSGSDWAGTGFAALGDVNGDGLADFFLGVTGDDTGGTNTGSAYLIAGDDALTEGGASTASSVAQASIIGGTDASYLGNVLGGPGDMDGDGHADFVVGSSLSSANGSESGVVWLFLGSLAGSISTDDADATVYGTDAGDRAGAGVAEPGDVDGDGYADLWVGASREDEGGADGGAYYLLAGTSAVDTYDLAQLDTIMSAKVLAPAEGLGIGASEAVGDFDEDGAMDLVVGSALAGLNGEGAAYLTYGPITGTLDLAAGCDATFVGNENGDSVGRELVALGDAFGTGEPVIGVASWEDDANGADAGALFLLTAPGI